ncbi:MAG: glucosaminidase domain-containing protein [Chitinophagaceae bacterium]|nr:glucosaminidase domain-containing protein [Chitinophagaceae bacterium]
MKKLILFLCLSASLAVHAQKEKVQAYVETYKELAIAEMMRTGVPAAITLAQGILESQSGQSDLVKNSNNHFGIKCKTEWTGEKFYHDDDTKGECFRVYPTADQSYIDHSNFLKTRPPYAFLFKLDPTDFEGWARGLKKAGYATEKDYAPRLIQLINTFGLQQYSLEAIARLKNGETPFTTGVVPAGAEPKKEFIETKPATEAASPGTITAQQSVTNVLAAVAEQPSEEKTINTAVAAKVASYPTGVFTINHTKVVFGTAGTSLLSLADQYELPLSKLLEFNDLAEMDVLDTDRLMFLEKKQKKGAGDFHMVADGETLHGISQLEGVRLESLLEYNSLKKGSKVSTGDKIYLRTNAQAAVEKPGKNTKKITG